MPLSRKSPAHQLAPLRNNTSAVKERYVDTDTGFNIVAEQDCTDVLQGVKDAGYLLPKKTKGDGARYMGSIPLVFAQQWAKECGAKIGTKEFSEYAFKKMLSGEFAKLRVDRT